MVKERKAQDEDPTSHIQEEESTYSPAESVVDEPNPKKRKGNDSHATFCANAQYHTLGELPPELQKSVVDEPNPTSHLQEEETTSSPAESVVDEPNPKKRKGNDSHATFRANAQYHTLGELPPELQFNLMKDNLYFSFAKIL